MFHVDRRTEMTKPVVSFRNFVKSPKNQTNNKNLKPIKTNEVMMIVACVFVPNCLKHHPYRLLTQTSFLFNVSMGGWGRGNEINISRCPSHLLEILTLQMGSPISPL
jgi:hypothetical protein